MARGAKKASTCPSTRKIKSRRVLSNTEGLVVTIDKKTYVLNDIFASVLSSDYSTHTEP